MKSQSHTLTIAELIKLALETPLTEDDIKVIRERAKRGMEETEREIQAREPTQECLNRVYSI